MQSYPISPACPCCGRAAFRKRRFSRECRVCRTRYQPPTPSWWRWTFALGLIVPGTLLTGAALGAYLVLEPVMTTRGPGAPDPFSYVCWGVLGLFGIVGLLCVARGLKGLLGREAAPPAGLLAASDPGRVPPPARAIPAARASALAREVAERHHRPPAARLLGEIGPNHLGGPVASFATELGPDELPLLLFDLSWRRDGRAGILVTNRRLYSSRLDGPIELEDVSEVAFRDISESEMAFKVLLFGIFFLVGHIFLLHGRLFARRLVVNGDVVYEGRADVRPEFWVDLLTTLADAAREGDEHSPAGAAPPADRPLMTALETLPHSAGGLPLDGEVIDDPSWEQVERCVRAMDGHAHPLVRLWAGEPWESAGLEIIGGNGKFTLREVGDGWVYYDPGGAEEEVEVQTSGAGHRAAGYFVCTDVERVLQIVRRLCETGAAGDD